MITAIEPKRDIEVIPMLSNGAKSVRQVGELLQRGTTSVHWTVAHCRSRHEKSLAIVAEDSGFGYFLPLELRKVTRHGHGTSKSWTPFPELDGYVFLASTCELEPGYPIPRDLHDFLEDQYSFFGIIEVRPSQQQRFITDLERLHSEAAKGRHKSIVKGQRCRVVRGPYMGLEGVIEAGSGKGYVRLTVDAIKSVSMFEIPAGDLEAI